VSGANLLIRGGYVLTMDSAGDIPGGDVHVADGVIQSIGRNLDLPEAKLIDASGKIVAPGLVDTHWHMWNALLRGMSDGLPGADDAGGYFATSTAIGRHFRPGDSYAGTLLAAAEAIDAGITTVQTGRTTSGAVNGPTRACARWPSPACGPASPTATRRGTPTAG
jgi:cytosine/adenosine deaminase-related metal-dependent hydrolase